MGVAKTNGGVAVHAVKRILKQYSCPLDKRAIRKVVRAEKNASGVNNGYFIFSDQAIRKLRLTVRLENKMLIGVVSDGAVVTVKDKDCQLSK